MAKSKSSFVCNACGNVTSKWEGQCGACGEWNSITEEAGSTGFSKSQADKTGKTIDFVAMDSGIEPVARKVTAMSELDRVLGGGLVPGSAILIGGDPGIGKSTILLQMAAHIANSNQKCAYITGEESADQVRMRAKRLGLEKSPVQLAATSSVADIISSLRKEKPDVVIIDSIQTMYIDQIESAPGTVSQVRTSAHELIQLAKQTNTVVILVGHVTKEGQIAGPKVLEHMVDTVLYFEGDRGNQFRILRSVKNRYGAANEIGVFEMTDRGLQEVTNPSSLFLSEREHAVSGSVVFPAMEGTRTVMVEVQALVSPTNMAQPRRTVVGWDQNRLSMILAVLQTRANMKLMDKEVYLNVAGGLKINEPAADLAVAAAIVSALTNVPVAHGGVILGEIGLSGEIRPVSQTPLRLKESEKLGFSHAVLPSVKDSKGKPAHQSKSFILREIQFITQLKDLLGTTVDAEIKQKEPV